MTPEQFCYWLNGFGELSPEAPTAEQWKAIKEHLKLVFTKVTPKAPGNTRFEDELRRAASDQKRAAPQPWPGTPPYQLPPYAADPLRVTY